jgi:putative transposase
VWLYHRFPLSFREVEELMMERGVMVSYETIRQWCRSLGRPTPTGCAAEGHSQRTGGHRDEVFITIQGKSHYL